MPTNRRDFLKGLGVTAAASLWSPMPVHGAEGGPSRPPNIIYILADDLGYGDLGCYGQARIKTPCLDRMAAEGMRFTQHYAGSTVCAPSRATLMLGYHTGHLKTPGQGQSLRPEDRTAAKILKAAGYVTGCIGKWGLGQAESHGVPTTQGFDHFFGYLNQTHAHNYYPAFLWRNDQRVPLRNEVKRNPKRPKSLGGAATKRVDYSHDLFAEDALRFLEQHRDKPFFLYLPFTIPHANNESWVAKRHGMEVPDYGPYATKDWPDAQKGHAAMITRLDRDVGRLLKKLQELGIDRQTVVMFSSDNGPHKEGGALPDFFQSSGPLKGIKRDLYDGGIRVPMIVRWPGTVKSGTVSHHISAFWDFLPTVCDLVGLSAPKSIDGLSFAPTLRGQAQKEHEYLYWEFLERGGKQALRLGKWKAVRLGITKNENAPIELYDIENDLRETKNVAKAHPDVVARAAAIFATVAREHPTRRSFDRLKPKGSPPPLPDVYISDLEPFEARSGHEPLGPPKKDRSIRGETLTVAGKQYNKGMGLHAPGEIVFALKPEYARFVAKLGVDDARPGTVTFEVFVDNQKLFESPVLRQSELWYADLPIPPAGKRIRLKVTDGGNGKASDHADWLEAGFILHKKR